MKTKRAGYLICFCILFLARTAPCQSLDFGAGIFLSFGGESAHTPHFGSGAAIPLAGIYAEWLKPRLHPGLDLRVEGGSQGVHGLLVGPRASMSLAQGWINPYAEALLGPNEANLDIPGAVILQPGQQAPNTERAGVTVQGVVGLDFGYSEHYRWRVEFSQSRFSGIPDSHPHAVTTGLVIHF